MRLGVNIDHVATLRQQRRGDLPSLQEAALAVQAGGADGIVVHLREDRRHIQDRDVAALSGQVGKPWLFIPWSLEMADTPAMIHSAQTYHAKHVCIVPESRQELTTEGGLDVVRHDASLRRLVASLTGKAEVSFFVDPEAAQIAASQEIGATVVELHTGTYAEAKGPEREAELKRLQVASEAALKRGLKLHAGHGLDYENVAAVARIPGMEMLNIGFSIVSRALFVGLTAAVQEMKKRIQV